MLKILILISISKIEIYNVEIFFHYKIVQLIKNIEIRVFRQQLICYNL